MCTLGFKVIRWLRFATSEVLVMTSCFCHESLHWDPCVIVPHREWHLTLQSFATFCLRFVTCVDPGATSVNSHFRSVWSLLSSSHVCCVYVSFCVCLPLVVFSLYSSRFSPDHTACNTSDNFHIVSSQKNK